MQGERIWCYCPGGVVNLSGGCYRISNSVFRLPYLTSYSNQQSCTRPPTHCSYRLKTLLVRYTIGKKDPIYL